MEERHGKGRQEIDLSTEILEKYPNGGSVVVYNAVDRYTEDFQRILSCAQFFAKQGKEVILPPKVDVPYKNTAYDKIFSSLKGTSYYGKCPDMCVEGVWYEHEGYKTDNQKHALKNMLKHGLLQSDRIVIEDVCLTERYILDRIKGKVHEGKLVSEVWIRKGRELVLVYVNTNDQSK